MLIAAHCAGDKHVVRIHHTTASNYSGLNLDWILTCNPLCINASTKWMNVNKGFLRFGLKCSMQVLKQ